MSQHPPGVPIQLVVGLLVPVLACCAAFAQQDPSAIGAREDPYFRIDLAAAETTLLVGEPPRLYWTYHMAIPPHPGFQEYVPNATGVWYHLAGEEWVSQVWVAAGAGPWQQRARTSQSRVPRGIRGPWASFADCDGRAYLQDLFLWGGSPVGPAPGYAAPAYAFPEPGRYAVLIAAQVDFWRWAPGEPRVEEVVYTTSLVASNVVEFDVSLPPEEREPWEYIRERGWFSGSTLSREWHGTAEDRPRDTDEAEEFVRRFPASRYADYVRLRLAQRAGRISVPMFTAGPEEQAEIRARLEGVVRLLQDIRLEGFSRADEALHLLAVLHFHLGQQAEADLAWQMVQDLPYPSPLKTGPLEALMGYPDRALFPSDSTRLDPHRHP